MQKSKLYETGVEELICSKSLDLELISDQDELKSNSELESLETIEMLKPKSNAIYNKENRESRNIHEGSKQSKKQS